MVSQALPRLPLPTLFSFDPCRGPETAMHSALAMYFELTVWAESQVVSVLEFLAQRELKYNVWFEIKISECKMMSCSISPVLCAVIVASTFVMAVVDAIRLTPLYKHNFLEMDCFALHTSKFKQFLLGKYANYFPFHSFIKQKGPFFYLSQE